MKPVLLGAAIALFASAVYAQNPAPAPEPNATAPSNQAAPATPDMKAQPDPSLTTAPALHAPFVADETWVGRYVYSSDGKDLGKIASVKRSGASGEIYFDMGGFLGLGATRKHVAGEQVHDVQNDRIVLNLTKDQAETLPAE
jgi:hypothetical protein